MEQKNAGKKKGSRGVSRKSFIIGIIALCLVALIAEVVLLVHGFSKKTEKKQPEQVTPTQVVKNDSTPTPTATAEPTPTPEVDHYESVWKLAKEYKTGSQGQKNPVCYMEYDEQGRESKRIVFDEDLGNPKETDVFHYDRSGITLVDRWIPTEENGELAETLCFHIAADNMSFLYHTYYLDLDKGETVDSVQYDDGGNLTALTSSYLPYTEAPERYVTDWEIDSDGVLKNFCKSIEGVITTVTPLYDDSGRIIGRTTECNAYWDGYSDPWGIIHQDGYTYLTEEGNGVFTYVYKDGDMLMYTRYMGYTSDWPGALTVSKSDYVSPRLEKAFYFQPKGNFKAYSDNVFTAIPYNRESFLCWEYYIWEEDLSKYQDCTVEVRPDGQPVYAKDTSVEKYYEYDETGRLTRYHAVMDYPVYPTVCFDVLTELDENWNLVKKTDLINNAVYEYEWILIDIPVYE